jgi:hypothetical protein
MSKKPEKPKSRKAAAPKTTARKNGAKAAPSEPKRKISEIQRLVTRWRFLEAEEDYQAAIAKTDEESDALIYQHRDEQDEIEMGLSRLIPQDFNDVRELLDHAIKLMDGGLLTNGADVMMLKNVLESLPGVLGNTREAARLEGAEKLRGQTVLILENVSRNMDNFKWPA